ncbi:A-macroglobulin complement component, partial [Candidatus Sumerlaeota bacterium]|nr:A-macroglobulin complement component [Candidatus Sumerlaeota bacterium]
MKNARTLVFLSIPIMILFLLLGILVVGDIKNPEKRDCFLAHISTDKPIYRAGEEVYVRIVLVNAVNNKPVPDSITANMEIISPKGDTIARGYTNSERGSLGWKWKIGDAIPGGDYKVKASFPSHGYPPAERNFNIRAFRQKRLRTQIKFAREGYGPGDEVAATLEASRSEGGIPAGAKATVIARVDQTEAWRGETIIEDDGFAFARFKLPETIVEGDGVLSFAIEDGGIIETASKSIPILVSKVDLQAYPEGGDLVPDVENRVYFEAIAPNGRPADVTVELLDSKGNNLVTSKTEHEGRGRFVFTPGKDETYTLQVVEPWNVKTKITMPKPDGVIGLRSIKDKYKHGEPIIMEVASFSSCKVTLSRFETILDEKFLETMREKSSPEWRTFELSVPDEISGVLRVTAFDGEGKPRAERLIFREPSDTVNIEIEPDQKGYVPGDKVNLKIKTLDQTGKPVAGVVGITITDDAVLEMIETREKAPRLPAQVFLEHEARELFDSHVYLSEEMGAPKSLDLLLGTQGWRRFAFYTKEEFLKKYGDAGRRGIADLLPRAPQPAEWFAAGDARLGVPKLAVMNAAVENGAALEADFDGVIERMGRRNADKVDDFALVDIPQKEEMQDLEGKIQEVREMKKAVAFDEEFGVRRIAASSPMPLDYMAVREYAHKVRPNRQPDDRVDFTETLYWNAGIVTNDKGEAEISFDLSDSVTSFRILADGYTGNGAFGASDEVIESRRPFYIEAKIPLEVTAGDVIDLPVVLVNETDDAMEAALAISTNQGITIGEFPKTIEIPA